MKFVMFVKSVGLVAWLLAIIGALLGIMVVLPLRLSGFNIVWYFLVPVWAFLAGGAIGWKITHRNTVVVVPATTTV